MQVAILGSLEVTVDNKPVALTSATQRRIVAALVVRRGDVVAAERLADMAGVSVPALRTAISRLRAKLGSQLVSTTAEGYTLGAVGIDVDRFDAMLDRSFGADPAEALQSLGSALLLWRGEPYAELGDAEWAGAEAARLAEVHAAAIEHRAAAMIDLGRFSEAAAVMQSHAMRHPLRDRPVGLLMRGLAAQGRQSEALRVFQDHRRRLIEEIGLAPGDELVDLEARIAVGWHDVATSAAEFSSAEHLPPPSGTVTFLFTDIEGSTALWEAHAGPMEHALTRHEEIVRRLINQHGGYIFAAGGDGFAAAFATAEKALHGAIQAQLALSTEPWPEEVPIRVRMGLHTGDAVERNGDYFGAVVNLAAKIASNAHGGQILTSGLTADLAPPDVQIQPLGLYRLRGLDAPHRLCQLVAEGLKLDFPALRSGPAPATNLPATTTTFVGRTDESNQILDALDGHRLVTLFGVGGVGKTRLAVEVARHVPAPDGAWIVELGRLTKGDQIDDTLAALFKLAPSAGTPLRESIVAWLGDREMLLILDNCEHVIRSAARLAADIAARTNHVTVLATSREPLAVAGEHLIPLGPLDAFESGDGDNPAVELFVDRATDQRADFDPGGHEAAIAEICERLDGIPLAIELAAARTRVMLPEEIAAGLDERFRLLTGGRRDALERQQTLRATVDWSYQLIDEPERAVFDWLSVFAGSFTMKDAVEVATQIPMDEHNVADAVMNLVDRSMVTMTDTSTPYRLLETLRAFGRLHLSDRAETDTARRSHADHFWAKASDLERMAWSPDQLAAVAEITSQGEDYLSAASWAIDHDLFELSSDMLLRIAAPTNDTTWWGAKAAIRQLVENPPRPLPQRWARVCALAAVMAIWRDGDFDAAAGFLADGLQADPSDSYCHTIACIAAQFRGDASAAIDASNRAYADIENADPRLLLMASASRIFTLTGLGRITEASEVVQEFAAAATKTGAPSLLVWVQLATAITITDSDPERALAIYDEIAPTVRALDLQSLHQQLARDRARALLKIDAAAAAEQLTLCLDGAYQNHNAGFAIAALPNVPFVLHQLGDDQAAATVAGSKFSHAAPNHRLEIRLRARTLEELRADLGETSYEAALAAGSDIPIDILTSFALERLNDALAAAGATT